MSVVDKLLVVDVGNTSIKYTAFEGGRVLWQVRDHEILIKRHFLPDAIYFASVRSQAASVMVLQEMQSYYPNSQLVRLESTAQACGVVCAYDEPWRLGIDRWLTVVAGFHHYGGNTVIIDAGTAIKVDVVNEQARHLGGYIVPGLMMMENALLANTAKIRYDASEQKVGDGLPNSTARAVNEGCHQMALGFLERVYRSYHDHRWVVTGGDAQELLHALGVKAECDPHLVALGAKLVGDEMIRKRV
ncbi:Type III pantothenate kinase [Marinomonas spartinae]|uniref:Type III pantothenate kinase n=1 Tax=Marinomonas spartinae TaxID=1792290 RepID=A0A1A8TTU2_9GAMM|nr:type III pantothenate kinase [Marinomonas spartinae]SBS37221.1 Type III pantothenate kinase [Marinomonas spartinae]